MAWVEGEAGAEMTTPNSLRSRPPRGAQAPWAARRRLRPSSPTPGASRCCGAIGNLVDNAVAHGGNVGVRLHDAPGELRIVVEDDGPGIAPADLARATEPYVRLDAARSLAGGGVGLGLAIVRDAAASHGGRLVLENRSEGGLRASLVLPRAA